MVFTEDSVLLPERRFDPSQRRHMKFLLILLAAAIGVAAVVFGGYDDSPGLQGLGGLFLVGAVALGVRAARRSQ
jgi:hypothetical protein